MAVYRVLYQSVARLVVKDDEEVRDRKEQGFLLGFLNNEIVSNTKLLWGSLPCTVRQLSPASRVPITAPPSQVSGLLYPSPRQSLELKTGVINHSLGLLITARLHTRSPAADSALPRPLLQHTPTARLRPGSRPACSPPPIPGEEVGYRHLRPRPVDHLELKRL